MHIRIKFKCFYGCTRVTAGLLQFGHNISERGHAHIGSHIAFQVYGLTLIC